MVRHVVALQRLTVDAHELLGTGSPRRQTHIVHSDLVLGLTQVETIEVAQHLGCVEHLRYQLELHKGYIIQMLIQWFYHQGYYQRSERLDLPP